jgi:hypothetical protein
MIAARPSPMRLDQVAEGYRAMEKRDAIKTRLRQ